MFMFQCDDLFGVAVVLVQTSNSDASMYHKKLTEIASLPKTCPQLSFYSQKLD